MPFLVDDAAGFEHWRPGINDEGLRVVNSLPAIHTLDLRGCPNASAAAVASLSISKVLVDDEDDKY